MNERIQVFAEQCYEKHELLGTYEFNKEKFAELIVRECALTAGLMEHEGRKNIGAQILDNFGIKDDE
jgi:hypothetical protein